MIVTPRLALVLLVVAPLTAAAQDMPVTVRGRVIAADNSAALPRARVSVLYSDPILSSYTNDRGEFSIAAPRADSFTLSVVKAGYAESRLTLQRAALTAAPARDVEMALRRSAAVSGLIVDPRGETVVGLSVYADRLDPDAETPAGLVKFATTTDDLGEYRLGGLPPGKYSVTATGAQDPGAVVRLDLRPGDEVADIGFTARPPQATAIESSPQPRETSERATIRGRVVTTIGRPIAQAVVSLTGPMPPRFFVTDAQGRFAFTGLNSGDYEVQASRGDFLPSPIGQQTALQSSSRIAVTAGARVNDVTLVLSRGLAVTGAIVDRAGEPLQGVSVQALQVSTSGNAKRAVLAAAQIGGGRQTDDRGRYRLIGLQPGTYVIVALADVASLGDARLLSDAASSGNAQTVPFYFPGSASIADAVTVTVTTAEVGGIDFAIGDVPSARVTGVALDSNGAPVEGTIQLMVSRRSGHIVPGARTVRTTAGGAFTFLNVAPGDYVVQALRFPPLPNFQLERPVAVDFRDSVEFAADYVTVGAIDAEPVTLRTARGSTLEATLIVDSASPSESPDRIQVDAQPIEGDLTHGSFSMRTSGVPVSGGNRRLRLTLIGPWRFVVSGMPDGWYLKSVTINGSEMTDQIIDLGVGGGIVSGELVISPRGGTIVGRITTERRAARDGAAIVVFPQDREKLFERSRFIKVVRASQDGSFRASSLPPGEYYVAVTTAEQAETASIEVFERLIPRSARVMLDEGDERRVDLALP